MTDVAVKKVAWRIAGESFGSCNCDWACPCQFNQGMPTRGRCEGMEVWDVREGHFGDVSLDGVRFAWVIWMPGPVHEGGGSRLLIVDESTSPEQREALEAIASGEHGHRFFEIFTSVTPNVLDTVVAPIELSIDREARLARVRVDGVLESTVQPIMSPATGVEHRVRIDLPNGFEFKLGEIANTVHWEVDAGAPITISNDNSYAHLYSFDWDSDGGVR